MPVIHLAAMYGTNPVILERDNPLLAAYSRAVNGNSTNGTAVGLLALKKSSILAVRPADGVEARRFNPSGEARKGGPSWLHGFMSLRASMCMLRPPAGTNLSAAIKH
jgi:hypothetical protein